jgi:HK97 family phage portal protein
MKLFNFLKRNIETKSIPQQSVIELYRSAPNNYSANPVDLIAKNKGYVFICNSKNASAVANAKFRLYTTTNKKRVKGEWVKTNPVPFSKKEYIKNNIQYKYLIDAENIEEIIEHPFLDLIYSVSSVYDKYSLFSQTEQYLGLIGNCYWHLNVVENGIQSIEILPSEYVSVMLTNNEVTGYKMYFGGKTTTYKKEEIVHFKNVAPGTFEGYKVADQIITGVYGYSSLEACLDEVMLMEGINKFETSLANNNARPDMMVRYKQSLDNKQKQDLYNMWNQIYRGNRNAGKVNIAAGDDFEIKTLGFPPKDLQFAEGKKWLRTMITNAFGVPEDLITSENTNRASSQTAIEQYNKYTILPKLNRIADTINQTILPIYDNNLFIVYDDPTPQNVELNEKIDIERIKNGLITVDEWRASKGMNPLTVKE